MISWISRLCVLCAVSALMQMMLPSGHGRSGIRLLCGMLMIRMTCESAARLLEQLANCTDLMHMLGCLIN